MLDFYIGQAGIPPDKFWSNTWRENALLGESWSINVNLNWEMTRYISAMVWNAKAQKKSQFITPDKLFPLPQDILVERGVQKSTLEQMKEYLAHVKSVQEKGKPS